MTSSWYGEVKSTRNKTWPSSESHCRTATSCGLRVLSQFTTDLNERGMWKSLSAVVRSVKWLTVSYTAAGLLPVTVRALGTQSSVYCCDKDGVRSDFQSPYTLSWRGAKTEEKHYLYLPSFPNLGFGLESRRKVWSIILCRNVHR
jgi:hypothetical protein